MGTNALYTLWELIGILLAGGLSLCIFSFLAGDNPFYKFAEHLLVGVSAGYWMCFGYWQGIHPYVVEGGLADGEYHYLIPVVLGFLLLARLIPGYAWLSRWPMAFVVGVYAGLNLILTLDGTIYQQVLSTIQDLTPHLSFTTGDPLINDSLTNFFVNIIIFFGVLSSLVYFYFSVEHKGAILKVSRLGIYVLMIALGASFGNTVMGRVTLLIGRVQFFIHDFYSALEQVFS